MSQPRFATRPSFPRLFPAFMLGCALAACGKPRTPTSELKIRGGDEVAEDAAGPERVSTVGLKGLTRRGSYTCSAAVIAPDVLVTAAHCVLAEAKLYAYFGPDMTRARRLADFTAVTRSEIHPDFAPVPGSGRLVPHDIALLKLASPIPATHQAAPVLPADADLGNPSVVRLAGYGITGDGDGSDVLRWTDATYVGLDAQGRLAIDDPQRHGACSGDSGGPLFARKDGVWHVAGVLSGGPIPCRGVNVYTSLAAHEAFIARARQAFASP